VALAIREKALGSEHPDTRSTRDEIAALCRKGHQPACN
jgi:hypothetical protein